jgi:hypothetical protein
MVSPHPYGEMKIIELESWEEFCTKIELMQVHYKDLYEGVTILFRGQAHSKWHLETTLERFSKTHWTIQKYFKLVIDCIPQIESSKYYPTNISIPSTFDIEKALSEYRSKFSVDLLEIPTAMSFYLTYFRHYGFPSPLLDWSLSPYVAAFFAFCENLKSKNVAIFAFIDNLTGCKRDFEGKPRITTKWLNAYPHDRHTWQQSLYSVATIPTKAKNDHKFVHHKHVFKEGWSDQDVLIKYIVPKTERIKVLDYLDREKNINHLKMMRSEEAFFKTLAFRQIEIKNL